MSLFLCIKSPEELPMITPVVLASLVFPAVLQPSFAAFPGPWSKGLAYSAYGLMAIAMFGPQMRDFFENYEYSITILWGLITLYVSVFFWFWSHPEITRVDE